MISERVSYEQLLGISGCLALALLAHVSALPIWVFGIVAACAVIRLVLARRGRSAPSRAVLVTVALLAVPLLFIRFHTFNGLVAGTALLSVTAGLKLLETKTQRDIYIITLIVYFVSLAALLEGDSFWLLAYLIGVCWLTTATLLRLTSSGSVPGWRRSLRYGGRVLLQALPLALVFWLLFPRFAAPLWHIPSDSQSAASGLGDTMSPGDINQLALSDEVAFRVRFDKATPPSAERYWRGPVLDVFDGHTWSHSAASFSRGPGIAARRSAVSIHGDDGTASASLDLHARLAQQLELAARSAQQRLHLVAGRSARAPCRCGRHLVHQGPVDRAAE